MKHFKNFKTCVYCTAQTLASLDETTLARDYAYLEKYVGIDKVYLETYRDGTWVAIDHMKMIQMQLLKNQKNKQQINTKLKKKKLLLKK